MNDRQSRAGVWLLPALALVPVVLQIATARSYGYFRDELYYLACTDHLAWGYVDHPPLSIFVLWIVRRVLGDSLPALRLVPALAVGASVLLTGWMCRRMGGGRFGQRLALVAAIVPPVYLFSGHVYSMNALDLLLWTAAAAILVRIFSGGDRRLWLGLGVVLGLGLLNKISVLWLGFGLAIGLRASRAQRGWYMTPWPWIAGAIAFVLFAPHLAWQVAHRWPTLEFMRNATRLKMAETTPVGFLAAQLLLMSPLTLPLWGTGLVWLLAAKAAKPFRALGIVFVLVLAILLTFGSSKPSYLGPAFPALFAAGGVAVERVLARRPVWTRLAALGLLLVSGIALAPFGLPLLPVPTFVRYARAIHVSAPSAERHEMGELPQHYADMHGWESIAASVARAYDSLPDGEKAGAGIFAQNYGEAAAIDFFGARAGLPRAMSGHNAYWMWGPRPLSSDVMIVLGGDREDNEQVCGELEQVGATDCAPCMPYEDHLPIYVCRHLKTPLADLWPRLKRFI